MMAEGDNKSVNMLVSICACFPSASLPGDRKRPGNPCVCGDGCVSLASDSTLESKLRSIDGIEGQREHICSLWMNVVLRSSSEPSTPPLSTLANPARVSLLLRLMQLLAVTAAAANG